MEAHFDAVFAKAQDKAAARDNGRKSHVTFGRAAIEKIQAVEGVAMSEASRAMFKDFDSHGLTTEEHCKAIVAKHTKTLPSNMSG